MRHEKGIGHELRYGRPCGTADGGDHRCASGERHRRQRPRAGAGLWIEVELARLERLLGPSQRRRWWSAAPAGLRSRGDGRWRRRCRIIGLTWWPQEVAEEVARAHGYDRIPRPPARGGAAAVPAGPSEPRHRVRRILGGLGLDEVVLHALIGADDLARSGYDDADPDLIRLANPLAEQHSIMRPVPYLSMLAALAENVRQRRTDPWLFEVGKTYWMGGSRAVPQSAGGRWEAWHATIGLLGPRVPPTPARTEPDDVAILKG